MDPEEYIWKDRKRIIFGLPWSFTRYRLLSDKLIIDTGLFSRTEDEIRLYRIVDITLRRSLWERFFGLGTIRCYSGDQTSPEFDISHIKRPKEIKEKLSEMVERKRNERRVGVREFMGVDDAYDDIHDDFENI